MQRRPRLTTYNIVRTCNVYISRFTKDMFRIGAILRLYMSSVGSQIEGTARRETVKGT